MATKLISCLIEPFGTSKNIISVYADPGMGAVIEKVEGVTAVHITFEVSNYIAYLDPRYDRAELEADIVKAVAVAEDAAELNADIADLLRE